MGKISLCILLFIIPAASIFSQVRTKFEDLPVSKKTVLMNTAVTYRDSLVSYDAIAKDVKQMGLDFSKMSIEDAVMMMFMLISQDAKKDIEEQLKEMEATRQKRQRIREQEEQMKKEMDSLRNRMKNAFRSDSFALQQRSIRLQQYIDAEKAAILSEQLIAQKKTAAEKRLASVEVAIMELEKKRPGKTKQ